MQALGSQLPLRWKFSMAESGPGRRPSRRDILLLLPLIALSGCTSGSDQARQQFYAAVKADPMFTWRQEWVTTDLFTEKAGGYQPFNENNDVELVRLLGGAPVPSGAADAAGQFAIASGWAAEEPQFFRRNFSTSSGVQGARLQIFVPSDYSSLELSFAKSTPLS